MEQDNNYLTRNVIYLTHNAYYLTRKVIYLTHNAFYLTRKVIYLTHNAYNLKREVIYLTYNAYYLTRKVIYLTHNATKNLTSSNLTHQGTVQRDFQLLVFSAIEHTWATEQWVKIFSILPSGPGGFY